MTSPTGPQMGNQSGITNCQRCGVSCNPTASLFQLPDAPDALYLCDGCWTAAITLSQQTMRRPQKRWWQFWKR